MSFNLLLEQKQSLTFLSLFFNLQNVESNSAILKRNIVNFVDVDDYFVYEKLLLLLLTVS